jgi:hypothetical protein
MGRLRARRRRGRHSRSRSRARHAQRQRAEGAHGESRQACGAPRAGPGWGAMARRTWERRRTRKVKGRLPSGAGREGRGARIHDPRSARCPRRLRTAPSVSASLLAPRAEPPRFRFPSSASALRLARLRMCACARRRRPHATASLVLSMGRTSDVLRPDVRVEPARTTVDTNARRRAGRPRRVESGEQMSKSNTSPKERVFEAHGEFVARGLEMHATRAVEEARDPGRPKTHPRVDASHPFARRLAPHLARARASAYSRLLVVALAAAPITACASAPDMPFGAACNRDGDCASGMCEDGYCSQSCSASEQCVTSEGHQGGCAHTARGLLCNFRSCYRYRGTWSVDPVNNVCTDRVMEACELLAGDRCTNCERAGTYYDEEARSCAAPKEGEQPCHDDFECVSGKCKGYAEGICTVRLGAPCTDANCDLCRTVGESTQCSKGCSAEVSSAPRGDCPSGFWCGWTRGDKYSNNCIPECRDDADCPTGSSCVTEPVYRLRACVTDMK